MILSVSKRLSSFCARSGIIQQEDEAIYRYGFEVFLAMVMNFLVLLVIAAISRNIWATTMFMTGFIPLRAQAGGYHAKTHFHCLVILLIVYIAFLITIHLLMPSWYVYIIIMCLSISIPCIWFMSPVEDQNKPLNTLERKHFRSRSRAAILIYTVAIIISALLFNNRKELMCIAFGIFSVSLSLSAACLRNTIIRISNGRANAVDK